MLKKGTIIVYYRFITVSLPEMLAHSVIDNNFKQRYLFTFGY